MQDSLVPIAFCLFTIHMLYLYTGTDREKARAAMNREVARLAQSEHATVLRLTDANVLADLQAALKGGGMFGGARVLVCEDVLQSQEMKEVFLETLPGLSRAADAVFIYEEKPDAATRRMLEKYAHKKERFDAAKKAEDKTAFSLAYALQKGDRKALWVGYMRELQKGSKPEMVHGILFWAAK